MKRRRGYTLIEALVMITLIGITLSTVAVTLHAMHRAQQRLRDDSEHRESLARLAAQLRSDGHQADTATVGGDTNKGQTLRLTFPAERTIEYTIGELGIDRTVRLKTESQHRETYAVSVDKDSRWDIDTNRGRPLVSVSLPLSTDNGANRTRTASLRLTAAIHIAEERTVKGE